MHKLRSDLPLLTERIAALPVDERGYPVPFFVAWVDGKPDFRIADGKKWQACVKPELCWTCGQKLGQYKTFPIGPMCSITRTTAEPPSHLECAEWSVRGCPFLSKPQMVRRDHDQIKTVANSGAGISIDRSPGVTCLWTTTNFKFFSDHQGKPLIRVGQPMTVTWWREGRAATREEVLESMTTGLPFLEELCSRAEDRLALKLSRLAALEFLPKEAA